MRHAIAILMILCLASCTKSNALKGIGIGAGMMITGVALVETGEPSRASFNFSTRETIGGVMAIGGFALGTVSLLTLIVLVAGGKLPANPPPPAPGPPTEHCGIDGSCVPIGPPKPQ